MYFSSSNREIFQCILSIVCRYLRAQNAYTPSKNVQGIVAELKTSSKLKSGCNGTQFNLADKFNFLLSCAEKFQHTVPNSILHEITTIGNDNNLHIEIKFGIVVCCGNKMLGRF